MQKAPKYRHLSYRNYFTLEIIHDIMRYNEGSLLYAKS